jgi:hypothetical protein
VREEEFRAWLQAQEYSRNTVATYLSDGRKVNQAYDLDSEYDGDHCASLLDHLAYSKDDEATGAPNPSAINIAGPLYSNLMACRAATRAYVRFRSSVSNPGGRLEGLDRDKILQAIQACDDAGSVEVYIATLEGLGDPTKFWLLFEGRRYPSKAIVRDALSRAENDWQPGGTECKAALEKLGFVVIDWPEVSRARDVFLAKMPGFSGFRQESGEYWEGGGGYKNELIAEARAIAGGDRQAF